MVKPQISDEARAALSEVGRMGARKRWDNATPEERKRQGAVLAASRGHRGGRGPQKLTQEMVDAIRQRVAGGEKRKDMAVEYGVCIQTIGQVVRRQIWK